MVVRLKEGCKPYTAGDGIDISDNKVISVLLRATNNLIHVNEDGELYTDLQLEDGIEPNDVFPVGITTGKILQEDGWPQNGIIINWKTTSGDYARLILANDGKLYLDPGTGVWQEVGSGGGGGDSNVKLFTPSDLYDVTTGQAILNWYQQGKCPLIKYNGDTYVPTSSSGGILFVGMHVNRFSGLNNGVSYTLRPSILLRYEGNVFVSFSEDAVQETDAFISTSVAYNSPFNPTQPYHPATKKYVDDKVTYIGSTAPSNPYEGQVWYDTTNDVLKTYDGSQWNQVGGPSANVYVYKGSVTNYSDLANIQNPQAGDVYNVVNAYQSYPAGTNFAWTGTAWDSLGGSIDTSVFVTTNTAQSISGAKTFTAEPVLPNKTADATNSGTAPATEAQVYSVALKTTQISSTAPVNPTEGMLWYDTTNDVLKSYDGTQWRSYGGNVSYSAGYGIDIQGLDPTMQEIVNTRPGPTVSDTAPDDPSQGDLWYDEVNDVLKAYDGTQWNTIGSGGGGGASWGSITGTLSNQTDLQDALDDKQDELTASNHIEIQSVGVTISDMQGPCDRGWHVPTMLELGLLGSYLQTFGVLSVDNMKTYWKLPIAGLRYENGTVGDLSGTEAGAGWYVSCECSGVYAKIYYFESGWSSYQREISKGYSLRPFKNVAVVPDSNWTTLYDGSTTATGAGIFWNATEGIISASVDGSNWITIADKNLGATSTYTRGDTRAQANCGNFYQWGNNYGFPWSGNLTPVSTSVDITGYGPDNYYSGSSWHSNNPWMDTNTGNYENLWGGVSQQSHVDGVLTIYDTIGTATSSTAGLVKLGSNTVQTVSANSPSSTASRTYPVQVNSTGQAVVNVPWTDSGGGSVVGLTTLSYGNSSWNDFLTAYNAGRIVYCKASSNSDPSSGTQGRMAFMAYVNISNSTPTSVEFQYYRSVTSHTVSQQGDQVYIYKLTNGGVWSVTVREAYTAIAAGTGLTGTYSNGTYTLSTTSSASNLTAVFDIPSTNSDMSSIIQWLTAGGVVVLRENLTIDGHAVEHYYHASVWDGTYGNTISADKIVGTTMTTKTFTYNSGGTCTNIVTTTTSIGGGGGSGDVQVSTQANNILTSGAKLWAGTPSDYAGLSSYDNNTIYLTVTPSS